VRVVVHILSLVRQLAAGLLPLAPVRSEVTTKRFAPRVRRPPPGGREPRRGG